MKTIDEFMKALETDETLKAKLEAMMKDMVSDPNKKPLSQIDTLVKLAEENGYDVTVEDLSKRAANSHQLDESELDLITGGANDFCVTNDKCNWAYNSRCSFDNKCTLTYKCNMIISNCSVSNECVGATKCSSDIL